MSPVLEGTAIAAAAGLLLAKPAVGTSAFTVGAGIVFLGAANLDKIAEAVQKISDGIMDGINKLPEIRQKLREAFGREMRCEEENCRKTVPTSEMADHLQHHINILERKNVLNALKAKEAEILLKSKSDIMERDERQIHQEAEEARKVKQPRSNRKKRGTN